jgi:hypothetical protein
LFFLLFFFTIKKKKEKKKEEEEEEETILGFLLPRYRSTCNEFGCMKVGKTTKSVICKEPGETQQL